jgi:uncharacterized membrane protein YeaQ/YmgE (transglycosylase-associated protein family)
MIGALILGLVAGAIAKLLMPGDDPGGIIVTIVLGLVGAFVGWLVFTKALGIGDDDIFDLGGLLSAIIGTLIVLGAYRWFAGRSAAGRGRGARHGVV